MPATTPRTSATQPYSSAPQRWRAVLRRDARAAGAFVYAVTTTGVYCRPGCPARRPRREHVRFFATAAEAARAGFRPCKRCQPNAAAPDARQRELVLAACRQLDDVEPPGLAALARAAGLSPSHFHRVFKASVGVTPKAYALARRTARLQRGLAQKGTVTAALYSAGFNSSGRFYATSKKVLGMTPTALRQRGAGAAVRFAVGECALGSILVAATESGICAIALGDDPETLVRQLQARYASAELLGGDSRFETWVARVIGLVDGTAPALELPLDVRGTAFQQRVWQLLRKIPRGETRSYAEVARHLGRPNAVRAVARACAANEIAVAIPCHRVVRTDGSLSGYRWGIARKAALLQRERR